MYDFSSQAGMSTHSEGHTLGARSRKLTQKGLEYTLERKIQKCKDIHRDLVRKGDQLSSSLIEVFDPQTLSSGYGQWLIFYERLIDVQADILDLLAPGESLKKQQEWFKQVHETATAFKTKMEGALASEKASVKSESLQGSRKGSSRGSSKRSRRSSKLSDKSYSEEMQKQAELQVKAANLERKKQLERARLELQLQEEEMKIKEEMDLSRARLYAGSSGSSDASDERQDVININVDIEPEPRIPDPPLLQQGQPEITVHRQRPSNLSNAGMTTTKSDVYQLLEHLTTHMSASRIAVAEPTKFAGNALEFQAWRRSFDALVTHKCIPEEEKLYQLSNNVVGEARQCIEELFMLPPTRAYPKAMSILEERFGNPFLIGWAFRRKLRNWPKIEGRDAKGLRKYGDFLRQCLLAKNEIPNLKILDDEEYNQEMLTKLPDWIVTPWSRIVTNYQKNNANSYPPFSKFVDYVTEESTVTNNPIASVGAVKEASEVNFQKSEKSRKREEPKKERMKSFKLSSDTNSKCYSTKKNSPGDNSHQKAAQPTENKSCAMCRSTTHTLDSCFKFNMKELTDGVQFIKEQGRCFGCLRLGHKSFCCRNRLICKVCESRHPTSLHDPNRGIKRQADQAQDVVSSCSTTSSCNMYTPIVPVWVSHKDQPDKEQLTYALLDTQSDQSFISEDVTEALGLQGQQATLNISTMTARAEQFKTKKFYNVQIRGYGSDKKINLGVAFEGDIPDNMGHVPTPEAARKWNHLSPIVDHLMPYHECGIGLLIGYSCSQVLIPRHVLAPPEGIEAPFGLLTQLGWSMIGCDGGSPGDSSARCLRSKVREVIDPELTRMFDREFEETKAQDESPLSIEDKKFLQQVEKGTFSDHNDNLGRLHIPLPVKLDVRLPDNRTQAIRRASGLKRKLLKDEDIYKQYKESISKLLEEGHAELAPNNHVDGKVWYLPHHCVINAKKKMRIVFDASARYSGVALNDILLKGPDMMNSLIGVVIRFRRAPVAIACDIKAMFHQFFVPEEHRDLLRFVWFKDGDLDEELITYRMTKHFFGAASSPRCAMYRLQRIAAEYEGVYGSAAADFIRDNFYVDDGLMSLESEAEAVELVKNTMDLCEQGGLQLHKFISNSEEVMKHIPSENHSDSVKKELTDRTDVTCALGLQWSLTDDAFQFHIALDEKPLTKGGIVSTIGSVYDPVGLIAPIFLPWKRILQKICAEGGDWDEPVSEEIRCAWERWRMDLVTISQLRIARCYLPRDFGDVRRTELHHFSDASEYGYGQCSYLRYVGTTGKVHCSFVVGKSRVTPMKALTIPRLELVAAVLSVKISQFLQRELRMTIAQEYFYTDSLVVLGYLANEEKRFKVFVANCVQQVRDSTNIGQWHHVEGSKNTADICSRGLSVDKFLISKWFVGPSFLWEKDLPDRKFTPAILEDDVEIKKVCVLKVACQESSYILECLSKISSWIRMKRVIAWCLRWKTSKKGGPLSAQDLDQSERRILCLVQGAEFHEERKRLSNMEPVNSSSRLRKLDPFLHDGLICVGGRVRHADMDFEERHPIVLPSKHHVSETIIMYFHSHICHQGRGMTVNCIRSHGYWMLGLSSAVGYIISRCVVCRRLRSGLQEQRMADLPVDRLTPSPPFTYCATDLFGPWYFKQGRKEVKRYGVLCTCLNCRAIHLEVAHSLDTSSFINALRRFICIRGPIKQLRSDRGTNFVGAERELREAVSEMDVDRIQCYLANEGCEMVHFRMNVPSASHAGGVWERQIRSVRNVLSAVLRDAGRLDDENFSTIMCEVMAVVNSRPLTVENLNDPLSPLALTPNQLLTMKTKVPPPPGSFDHAECYSRKRWRQTQHVVNQFWTRWRREYLANISSVRQKWNKARRNAQVGDIVIKKDESSHRNDWPLTRIINVHQSSDGIIRSVTLRSGSSTYDRLIQKTVLLVETDRCSGDSRSRSLLL